MCILSKGLSWSNICNKTYLNFCLIVLNTSMFLYLSTSHFLIPMKSRSPLNSKMSKVNKLPKLEAGLNEIPGATANETLRWPAQDKMG